MDMHGYVWICRAFILWLHYYSFHYYDAQKGNTHATGALVMIIVVVKAYPFLDEILNKQCIMERNT